MVLEKDEEHKDDLDKFYIKDSSEKMAIQNDRLYRVKDTENTFRMFTVNGIATVAELRGGWAHTNNPSYYTHVTKKDSMFTNPIPSLKSVCWYETTCHVHQVPRGSYKLYVRHSASSNSNIKEQLVLRVSEE
jgi:hypothetical protein